MSRIAAVFACLVCAGRARDPSQNELAKLLLALEPSDGFKPSSPGAMSRRELLARAGAGLAALSISQAANAKQGEFSGLDFGSEGSGSLPYRGGGAPLNKDEDGGAGFGFALVEGKPIDQGWKKESALAKKDFAVSEKIFLDLQAFIDQKEWFSAGDDLRTQAYSMRKSMKQCTANAKSAKLAMKAYDKFWDQIGALNGALIAKSPEKAQKQYDKAITLLNEWKTVAL